MNSVNITARLTRDPERVETKGDTAVTKLRVAIDRRNKADGAVFIDVKTFGKQAEACAQYLSQGSPVAVAGRLELDQWEAQDGGKRSRVYVIGERVEFLPDGKRSQQQAADEEPSEAELAAVGAGEGDDDIPF
jgi:single-strand DNA-binding protein